LMAQNHNARVLLEFSEKSSIWRIDVFESKRVFDLFRMLWLGLFSRKCDICTLFKVC
jgi:hypothetical protein